MKAISHGALQLKDVSSAVQCLVKTNLERLKGKDEYIQDETISTTAKECSPEMEKISFSHCKGKLTGNGFEEEGTFEKVTPHGPMDNNQPVIALDSGSHAAIFPRDRDLSLSPEVQGQKQSSCPSLHVTQVGHYFPQSLASGSGLENVLTPHAKSSGTSLSNKEVSFHNIEKNHVGSFPSSLSFLEATIQGSKNPFSPSPLNGNELDSFQQASVPSDDFLIFKVEHEILQKRTELCRFSVLGKLTLAKGDEPWTWKKLKKKLDEVWGMTE